MSFAIAGVVIAATSLGYGIYNGEEQKKKLRSQEDDANKENSRLQVEAADAQTLSDQTANQQKARARQKALGPPKGQTSGTIMGGGYGSIPTTTDGSANAVTGKTLLGT